MIKIGTFSLDVIETSPFMLDGGILFGGIPKALWSKNYHKGDELNRIPLAARPLLVRWDGHRLLIETGLGTKADEKRRNIYGIDIQQAALEKKLQRFGLSCGDVTDVCSPVKVAG